MTDDKRNCHHDDARFFLERIDERLRRIEELLEAILRELREETSSRT